MPLNHFMQVATGGASRLVATQNDDGGWTWMNPNTNPTLDLPSPTNTVGITALGVLACNRKAPNTAREGACLNAFKAIVANSLDPDPSKHRIRGPDITFSAEYSKAAIPVARVNTAVTRWFSAIDEFGGGTATGFGQYIRDARKGQGLPALISWDINLYIQGLLAINRVHGLFKGVKSAFAKPHARELAEVIYQSLYVSPVDFDITDETQNEFWNGISGALEAFITTELHPPEVSTLATQLVSGQQPDGRFIGLVDGSDIQTTAYAVQALLKANDVRRAAGAVNFLVSQQLLNGGWLYDGGENTEVTSEAIRAILDYADKVE